MTLQQVLGRRFREIRTGPFKFLLPANPYAAGAVGLLCAGGQAVATRVGYEGELTPSVSAAFAADQAALTDDMYRGMRHAAEHTQATPQQALIAAVEQDSAE